MASFHRTRRTMLLVGLLLILPFVDLVLAQGFMVRPTVIDVELLPGRTSQIALTLQNVTADRQTLDLAIGELSQTPDGSWRLIEAGQQVELGGHASLVPWLRLEAESVEVEAQQTRNLNVIFDVPANARGAYFGAITAQIRPPERREGIQLILRFMIPLIIQIQGRPARQQVVLEDVEMIYLPAERERRATTLARMQIANNGQSFSRVAGDLRIDMQQGERWRSVARVDVDSRGIIPGVTLDLGDDLRRRLPSGTYRLRGTISVDGARVAPLDKVVQFEGDPEVTTLALDASLILEPLQIELEAEPGATRTTVVVVENPLTDRLHVRAQATIPELLTGVAMGDLTGEMMSAADWVQIRPAEFSLRPEGRQNLRVITRMPREGIDLASYYASLFFSAIYPDSQSAGETRTMLTVANRSIPANPQILFERLTISHDDASRYTVRGQFVNTGNVHIAPTVDAELRGSGLEALARSRLECDDSMLLPLNNRLFAGSIDFAEVDAGTYIVRANVRHEGATVSSRDLRIRVEVGSSGQRTVRIAE